MGSEPDVEIRIARAPRIREATGCSYGPTNIEDHLIR